MRRLPAELRTERLLLRQWTLDDAAALAEIYEQPEYLAHMQWRDLAQTRQQIEDFQRRWSEDGCAHWAAQDLATGRLVGRIGIFRHHDWPLERSPVEVGWTLHRDFHRLGLASEGGRASIEAWRAYLLDDNRLISITRPMNVRSRAVMVRLGLTYGGTAHWRGDDQVWYAIDRKDRPAAAR